MAYLNDVKLICNLAIPPEMALTRSGRQYCNFTVRLLYRTPMGDPVEDFIMATAYDDDAEFLVRDCKQGDLILVDGYLHQYKWQVNGETRAKVMVVASHIEILSRGAGMVPQPTRRDIAAANPAAYSDGEDGYISSAAFAGQKGNPNQPSHAMMYPQPGKGRSWQMPHGSLNEATRAWMDAKGLSHKGQARGDMGKGAENQSIRAYLRIPDLPDAVINKARMLIPDDLTPNASGKVKLLDGTFVPNGNYQRLVSAQIKMLDGMAKGERDIVLSIAEHFFGVSLAFSSDGDKSIGGDANAPENASAGGLRESGKGSGEGADAGGETEARPEDVATAVNPDDWVQKEDGTWERKTKA